MIGLDINSYEEYYSLGISKIVSEYQREYSELICHPDIKKKIWDEYVFFNETCKVHYMNKTEHLIDRHKVVACYMYAIERAHVLSLIPSLKNGDDQNAFLNEKLSFTFGMSLLRSLIIDNAAEIKAIETRQNVLKVFKGDVLLPSCTHGDFKSNMLLQLYYTWKESNYNILALAESLYLIECFNLVSANIPEDILKV